MGGDLSTGGEGPNSTICSPPSLRQQLGFFFRVAFTSSYGFVRPLPRCHTSSALSFHGVRVASARVATWAPGCRLGATWKRTAAVSSSCLLFDPSTHPPVGGLHGARPLRPHTFAAPSLAAHARGCANVARSRSRAFARGGGPNAGAGTFLFRVWGRMDMGRRYVLLACGSAAKGNITCPFPMRGQGSEKGASDCSFKTSARCLACAQANSERPPPPSHTRARGSRSPFPFVPTPDWGIVRGPPPRAPHLGSTSAGAVVGGLRPCRAPAVARGCVGGPPPCVRRHTCCLLQGGADTGASTHVACARLSRPGKCGAPISVLPIQGFNAVCAFLCESIAPLISCMG